MTITFLEVLLFVVGGPLLVTVVGDFWHYGAEHMGWFGDAIRYRHWIHHEVDYPTTALRPRDREKYKSAKSWSWYVASAVLTTIIFLVMPIRYAIPLIAGGVLFGVLVIDQLHQAFHLRSHPLARYSWFRKIRRRHDIHHFRLVNFGILFFFMDQFFGRLTDQFSKDSEELFPGFKRPI